MRSRRTLIQFRLLGQVEAWRDGERVELGGRKQRAVLASLLVRAGRVVSLDQLIDDLWPEHPPARAAATVQVFVSNLRRALEPDRPRGAPGNGPGHGVARLPARRRARSVDAHEFAALAEQGRAALDGDDPEQAAAVLRRAAELWRGPALADVPDAPFARAEAGPAGRAAAGRRRGPHRRRARAGPAQRAGGRAGAAGLRHPLRERLRAQSMLALYRCGRQADALADLPRGPTGAARRAGAGAGHPARGSWSRPCCATTPTWPGSPRPRCCCPPPPRSHPATSPGRVLVVDDSGVNRRLLVAALTELGHEVHAAENGRRALELLRERGGGADGYDVVLLDLIMPVLDGYATLAEIKADPALDHSR